MDLTLVHRSPVQVLVDFALKDSCFTGHFPGNPVVPGTLILALCLHYLDTIFAPSKLLTIQKFSFLRFAGPGSYLLSITPKADIYSCSLSQNEIIFAQGSIGPCS